MRITVYTKPGCHLCEDALVLLDRLTPQYGLQVDEVNILNDMSLYEQFKHEIPVLDIEGGTLGRLKAPIDEAELRAALVAAKRAAPTANPSNSDPDGGSAPRRRANLLDRVARLMGMHTLAL